MTSMIATFNIDSFMGTEGKFHRNFNRVFSTFVPESAGENEPLREDLEIGGSHKRPAPREEVETIYYCKGNSGEPLPCPPINLPKRKRPPPINVRARPNSMPQTTNKKTPWRHVPFKWMLDSQTFFYRRLQTTDEGFRIPRQKKSSSKTSTASTESTQSGSSIS